MSKRALPSEAQAKRIAHCWAEGRPINVMKRGRDGDAPYVDPTTAALLKRGWIEPSGGMPFSENGFLWEPYRVSDAGLFALECYLQKLRFNADAR